MKKIYAILVCVLLIATMFGVTSIALAAKGGGGKPGGGKNKTPADPAIAYSSLGPGRDLIVMNGDGSNKATIVDGPAYFPTWSPDGKHIAYVYDDYPTKPALWRVDINLVDGKPQGSNGKLLMSAVSTAYGHAPAWSPANDVIAYITRSSSSGPYFIWTVPINGGTPTQLLSSSNNLHYLAWNRDGTELAYVENNPGAEKYIRILTISSQSIRTVYGPTTVLLGGLDWARTQDKLALLTAYQSQGFGLYTLDLTDESATPQFIISLGAMIKPSWSPDDTHIAYLRVTLPSGSYKGPEKHDIMSIELSTKNTEMLVKESRMPDWRRPTATWPA
jgi:Tol biopolymer transport system component